MCCLFVGNPVVATKDVALVSQEDNCRGVACVLILCQSRMSPHLPKYKSCLTRIDLNLRLNNCLQETLEFGDMCVYDITHREMERERERERQRKA